MSVNLFKCLGGALIAGVFLTSCTSGAATPLASLASPQKASRLRSHQTGCPCLYVAENLNDSVAVYASGATGSATPLQYIHGARTKLNTAFDVAVDAGANIYVANAGNDSVTVFAAGANGNVKPARIISGASTGLNHPEGIALSPTNGNIYVANSSANSITIYKATANHDAAPISTISGSSTGLSGPAGLLVDASGNVYVPNTVSNAITVYAADSVAKGANNIAPAATITSTAFCNSGGPCIDSPYQLALDAESNVYVANLQGNGGYFISVFSAAANGDVAPIGTIIGTKTKLAAPDGVALDSGGNLYVANSDTHNVTIYAAGASGNVKPLRTVGGGKLVQPDAIAVR